MLLLLRLGPAAGVPVAGVPGWRSVADFCVLRPNTVLVPGMPQCSWCSARASSRSAPLSVCLWLWHVCLQCGLLSRVPVDKRAADTLPVVSPIQTVTATAGMLLVLQRNRRQARHIRCSLPSDPKGLSMHNTVPAPTAPSFEPAPATPVLPCKVHRNVQETWQLSGAQPRDLSCTRMSSAQRRQASWGAYRGCCALDACPLNVNICRPTPTNPHDSAVDSPYTH